MDALTLATWVAFYALFAVSIRRYVRRRTALDLGVLLVFGCTAAILAVAAVNLVVPGLLWLLGPLAVAALLAQPVAMLRLVNLFVPLRPWMLPAAVLAFVASVVAWNLVGRTGPSLLLIVAYFTIVEGVAAVALLREAARRHGFPKARLLLAGSASVLFASYVLVSGLASAIRDGATPAPNAPELLITRVLALTAALGYLAAFAPPPWLVRTVHRAMAFGLVRAVVAAPTGSGEDVHWRALAQMAGQILGTSDVEVWAIGGAVPRAVAGGTRPDAADRPSPGRPEPDPVVIPIVLDGRHVATLEARLPGRALFLEDDVALIELLASLTARAIEREQVVAGLAEARRAVAEAAAVRASEARFRALLDADPNAFLAVDASGMVRWATRSAARLFGLPEERLVGRALDSLVSPREAAGHGRPAAVAEVDASPATTRFETVGHRGDGSTFPAEVAISAFDFDGEPHHLAVVTDVTWRREADALRERFIGVLSHELRTPITAIFGGTQLLLTRGDGLPPEARAELLGDVAAEAERLQRMIENLLVLARVEGGAEVAEAGPVLLHRMLPAVIDRERALWPRMTIEVAIPAALPPVTGDEASLSLVLRNFISNAGKYAGERATVRVEVTRAAPGEVAVKVLDDGPGIDAAEAGRLFDLYFRSSASRVIPGSGIGLFVCHSLVAAMGGRTWARPRDGGGAEFGFTLPDYREPAPVVPATTHDPRPVVAGLRTAGAARPR